MTIPTTLSARRTELEREIEAHQIEVAEHAAAVGQHQHDIAIARAELHRITQSIEAYSAEEVAPAAELSKRERRFLQRMPAY